MSGFAALPPWDANRWFFLPSFTTLLLQPATVAPLCLANPMRVGLIFQDPNGGQTAWQYGLDPNTGATSGQRFPQNAGQVSFTHRDWAVLTQAQWFGFSTTGNVHVTTVELVLRDWPESDPADNMDVQDYLAYIAEFVKSLRSPANEPAVR